MVLGAVSGMEGLDKGQSFGAGARAAPPAWDSRWDGMKARLRWGSVALAEIVGLWVEIVGLWVGVAPLGGILLP